MMQIYWKLHDGNLLEFWVDVGNFFKEGIMAQRYGITLRFQGDGTRSQVEHPRSTDLSGTMRSKNFA